MYCHGASELEHNRFTQFNLSALSKRVKSSMSKPPTYFCLITRRKSTHGFPFLSRDENEAPVGGPLGRWSSAINFQLKLFTAYVKCNGTVIRNDPKKTVILFLSLNSRSIVATSSFGSSSTMVYASDLNWQWRFKFPVLKRPNLLSTPAFDRLDTHVRYFGIALTTHFSSSSRVLEGLIPYSAIFFAKHVFAQNWPSNS